MSLAIGIDIGGTKVAGGLVDETGRVLHRTRRSTPHRSTKPRVVEDLLVDVVDDLVAAAREEVVGIGIGAAGFVSAEKGTVVFAPHLSWRNEPLRQRLSERCDYPVFVDNDGNTACWAEWRFGAAKGESHLVMVNLGTGIAGAILTDGVLHRGRYGIAGEFGHMQVVPGGVRCECGNRGCWEQYASGNALVREARTLLTAQSPMAHGIDEFIGGDLTNLTGPMITEAAAAGDATAGELLAEIGTWLGVGLANLASAYDPGTFVIGGGVSAAGEMLLGPAREAFKRQLPGRGYRPEARIVGAALGNEAGLIGAADLARSEVSV